MGSHLHVRQAITGQVTWYARPTGAAVATIRANSPEKLAELVSAGR